MFWIGFLVGFVVCLGCCYWVLSKYGFIDDFLEVGDAGNWFNRFKKNDKIKIIE